MDNIEELLKNAKLQPLGEAALQVTFGEKIDPRFSRCARALATEIDKRALPAILETEVGYTGVAIFYDPMLLRKEKIEASDPNLSHSFQVIAKLVKEILATMKISAEDKAPKVRIPVCYGGEYGPDLQYVADYHKMTPEEVIKKHTGGDYLVYMIGFAPGFPYVGGLPEEIATPRRSTPRLLIPKGSVGIAGSQTGAYPLETPGGWQLIGRTPLELFRPNDMQHPSVLSAGDRLEFYAISEEEYKKIADQEGSGTK